MADFKITFDNPWLLLLVIPILLLIFIPFFKIPKKFRKTRNRVVSVTLHTLACMLCVALVAGVGFRFTVPNRENQIMLVVDCSDSNSEQSQLKEQYISNVINMCGDGFNVGVVTFGSDTVYAAELSDNYREVYQDYMSARKPDTSATNISEALNFASEKFLNPKTAKIVLLSDGYETDGQAVSTAQLLAAKGIKIDVVNFANSPSAEIQLTDVQMPQSRVMLFAETDLALTVRSTAEEANVTVTVTDNGNESEPVSLQLKSGVQTVNIMHKFTQGGLHDLLFTLKSDSDNDNITQNNVFQSYLNVTVFKEVLILESKQGESLQLQEIMRDNGLNVTAINVNSQPDLVPSDAKELAEYDQVVLVNIANSDLVSDAMPQNFDLALYRYVYDLGGSMFTVGGECDIGAGGALQPHAYSYEDLNGTLYQQMLPVQAIDYNPPVAVMVVVDVSGSMGSFDNTKLCAQSVFDSLNNSDYGGIMSFSTSSKEEATILEMTRKDELLDALDRLNNEHGSGSGGTIYAGAIDIAGQALSQVDVDRRHIILITDGDPFDKLGEEGAGFVANTYGWAVDNNFKKDITMSIITIDMGKDKEQQMIDTAARGGGNLYKVTSADIGSVGALMQQEFAEIKLDSMQEVEFTPSIKDHTSVFDGIRTETDKLPVLGGYFGTRVKEGVEEPLIYKYVPIYAAWQFGKGNVGSFMSTLSGDGWSDVFVSDTIGRQLIINILKSLAPVDVIEADTLDFVIKETTDNFSNRLDVYTQLQEGESVNVRVVPVSETASNFYADNVDVQSAGNNVSFTFKIEITGLYKVMVEKVNEEGEVLSDILMYRTFSYSKEYDAFRDEKEGEELLNQLAEKGSGVVVSDPVEIFASFSPRLERNYDPSTIFLIVAITAILLDVAVRKFKFKWIHEIIRDRREMKNTDASDRQGDDLK